MKVITTAIFIILTWLPLRAQGSDNLKEIVFNTSWYPQAQFAGYFVASKKGFYKKYGINTKFIFSDYEVSVKQNLIKGNADFGIMWLHEGLLAHSENNSLINIAQLMDSSNILIVSRNEKIKSLGIWKPFVKFLETYIHEKLSDSVEVIPVRDGNEAFIQGAVDAITVMDYNELNQLLNCGIDKNEIHIHKLSDLGLILPEDGIYCRRSYYEQNQKLCNDFVKASLEGWEYAFENIDEAVEICFNYIKGSNNYTNVSNQKLMLNSIKRIVGNRILLKSPKLNRESFDKMIRFLIRNELITTEIKYEQFCEGIQ